MKQLITILGSGGMGLAAGELLSKGMLWAGFGILFAAICYNFAAPRGDK